MTARLGFRHKPEAAPQATVPTPFLTVRMVTSPCFQRGIFWRCFIAGWMLLAPGVQAAQPTAPVAPDRLIRQLSAGSLQRRDDAAAALARLGPAALPAIEHALPTAHSEAAFRLPRIAAAIACTETHRGLMPTTVTLSVSEQPLTEVAAEIARQTGNRLLVPADAAPVSLSCQQEPFWDVASRLAAVAGGQLMCVDHPPGLAIDQQHPPSQSPLPAVISDLLRITVHRIDLLGPDGRAGHRLILRLAWEPRLSPVMVRLPLPSVVAEAEAGTTIRQPQRTGVIEPFLTPNRCWVNLPIRLEPPPPGSTVLTSLRGTVELWLPGFEHRFHLPLAPSPRDPGEADEGPFPPHHVGDLTVRLDAWWQTTTALGPQITVRVTAQHETPSAAFDSHRGWLHDHIPKLFLPDSTTLPATAHRVVRRSDRGLTLEATFAPTDPAPATGLQLGWRLPLGVSRLPIDFWLRQTPLPLPVTE